LFDKRERGGAVVGSAYFGVVWRWRGLEGRRLGAVVSSRAAERSETKKEESFPLFSTVERQNLSTTCSFSYS
jgi:hypothetical protein